MPRDYMLARMLKARAEHDEAHRQAQAARIAGQAKPSPESVISVAEAELLVQAHDYADGEVIGRVPVGAHLGDGHQRIVCRDGTAVIDPGYDHVLLPRDPTVPIGDTQTGWTSQSGREIRRYEVAG